MEEQLYLNLSEDEFTSERKILLRIFAGAFLLGSVYVIMAAPVFGHDNVPPILALAPFGIFLILLASVILGQLKRKDLFFLVDYGKIEFRFGILKAKRHSFKWSKISSLVMPLKQRKVKLILEDGSSFIINLNMIKRNKSIAIKKYIYNLAIEKEIKIKVVKLLS